MTAIYIREPQLSDETQFLDAMKQSVELHRPWVSAPLSSEEFRKYIEHFQQKNHKSYFALTDCDQIVGVFNISEIVRGVFQNAYLGFYGVASQSAKGYMSAGLKLVIKKVFTDLQLHRIEANIQPDNLKSIRLIESNGFRKEGYSPRYLYIDGEWKDHERWAMTYEDWVQYLTSEF